MTDPLTSADPEFWRQRYQGKTTPWDLGRVAPPFEAALKQYAHLLPPGKMAAVGSGHGHDAACFGQHGFTVTGFDYAPEAVALARERYGQWAEFVEADLFALPPAYNGQFNYVLEHTCFCAIPPNRRQPYVDAVTSLLAPGGRFLGIFWAHREEDGPPYRTDETEIRTLFSPGFNLDILMPAPDSVPQRRGEELLAIFTRK